jgi:hypothetical protein
MPAPGQITGQVLHAGQVAGCPQIATVPPHRPWQSVMVAVAATQAPVWQRVPAPGVPQQAPAPPQVRVLPHPSGMVPQGLSWAAQVVGVQPQTFGVPGFPPPQLFGALQVQVPPHPSLTSQTLPAQLGTHVPQTLVVQG